MRKYIKNKNFSPNNLKEKPKRSLYVKYLTLTMIIINLFLIPLNIEILFYENISEETIPVYEEIEEYMYYNEIREITEILNHGFIEGNIVNNNGQIITNDLEVIYKLEEEDKLIIKSVRKEEGLGYVLEVEL